MGSASPVVKYAISSRVKARTAPKRWRYVFVMNSARASSERRATGWFRSK